MGASKSSCWPRNIAGSASQSPTGAGPSVKPAGRRRVANLARKASTRGPECTSKLALGTLALELCCVCSTDVGSNPPSQLGAATCTLRNVPSARQFSIETGICHPKLQDSPAESPEKLASRGTRKLQHATSRNPPQTSCAESYKVRAESKGGTAAHQLAADRELDLV